MRGEGYLAIPGSSFRCTHRSAYQLLNTPLAGDANRGFSHKSSETSQLHAGRCVMLSGSWGRLICFRVWVYRWVAGIQSRLDRVNEGISSASSCYRLEVGVVFVTNKTIHMLTTVIVVWW